MKINLLPEEVDIDLARFKSEEGLVTFKMPEEAREYLNKNSVLCEISYLVDYDTYDMTIDLRGKDPYWTNEILDLIREEYRSKSGEDEDGYIEGFGDHIFLELFYLDTETGRIEMFLGS